MKTPEMPSQHNGSEKPKEKIWLITPQQFDQLPDGTELTDIFGGKFIKGQDEINLETQSGYIAFGFPEHIKPEGIQFRDNALREITNKNAWRENIIKRLTDSSEGDMGEIYGSSYANLQKRIANIVSKEDAALLKAEIQKIDNEEDLTDMGKYHLMLDMEALWKV